MGRKLLNQFNSIQLTIDVFLHIDMKLRKLEIQLLILKKQEPIKKRGVKK